MALNLPKQIRAGDSLKFTDSVPNYPAPTWTLIYTIATEDLIINISSSASGEDHEFAELPAVTTRWQAGKYRYQATISDGTDRFTVGSGTVEIQADFATSGQGELRHVEKTIKAIEALLENKATVDQQNYSIAGRSLARYTIPELLAWRDKYKAELKRLERCERIAQGLGGAPKIRARF